MILSVLVIAILLIGAGGFLGYDIFQDRQHVVVTKESVPANSDWEPYPSREMKPVFVLQSNTRAKVNRIRYGKDYMALKVETSGGEIGWTFHGDSFRVEKTHNLAASVGGL